MLGVAWGCRWAYEDNGVWKETCYCEDRDGCNASPLTKVPLKLITLLLIAVAVTLLQRILWLWHMRHLHCLLCLVLWIWMADPHTVHIFSLSCTLCDWCCHWHASSVFKCICTEVLSHFGLNWYNTISEDGYRFHFFVIHSIWSVSKMWFLCCQILCHSFHRYRAGRDNYPAGIQVEAEVPSIPSTLKAFCNK